MKKILSTLLIFLLTFTMLPGGIGGWNVPALAAEPTIVQIASGYNHSLALFSDGTLYTWGDNCFGQLGDGTYTSKNTPVQIGTGFTAIDAGYMHSLALKGNTLYSWGQNYDGQLGDGTNTHRRTPVQIGTGYTAIAAGDRHSLALKGNTLYSWGRNSNGELGDGTNINRNMPMQIGIGFTVIATSYYHSLALKGNILYAWGWNCSGQLGDGTNINRNTPLQIGADYTAISTGFKHTLTLKGNTLYAWGDNEYGQLGDGTTSNSNTPIQIGTGYTAIAAGSNSYALKGNTLFAWGAAFGYTLGDGTTTISKTPIKIGTDYIAISNRGNHTLAVKENSLYAWGNNSYGQLGDGTNTNRNTPTPVIFPNSPTPSSDTKITFTQSSYTGKVNEEILISGTFSSSILTPTTSTIKWSCSDASAITFGNMDVTDNLIKKETYISIPVTGKKAGGYIIYVDTTDGKRFEVGLTITNLTPSPKPTEVKPTSTVITNPKATPKPTIIPSVKPKTLKEGYYSFYSKVDNSKVIDVSDESQDNKALIHIWSNYFKSNQIWHVYSAGKGYYYIEAAHSGKVLDVANGSSDNGTSIWQYSKNSSDAQLWQFFPSQDQYVIIVPKCAPYMCLDLKSAKSDNGTKIQLYQKNNTNAQMWGYNFLGKSKSDIQPITFQGGFIMTNEIDVPKGNMFTKKSIQKKIRDKLVDTFSNSLTKNDTKSIKKFENLYMKYCRDIFGCLNDFLKDVSYIPYFPDKIELPQEVSINIRQEKFNNLHGIKTILLEGKTKITYTTYIYPLSKSSNPTYCIVVFKITETKETNGDVSHIKLIGGYNVKVK